jgi:hypothetical protein
LFQTLVDTKDCNSSQMDAGLGLKFVEGAIPVKKSQTKS